MRRGLLSHEISKALHQGWTDETPKRHIIGHLRAERLERVPDRVCYAFEWIRQRAIEVEEDGFDADNVAPSVR